DEDVTAIAALAKKVIEKYYQTENRNKRKQPQVTLSVACFIPKPFTPFQWERQNTAEELEKKQKLLLSAITDRKIRYNYHDAKTSHLEAVFARGNRRLGAALREAVRRGVRFDAWEEMFDYDGWMDIFRATGIDPAFFANREMPDDEVLPWDIIDCGVTKEFLIQERHKAREAATTPSCKEKCSGCGALNVCDKKYYRWCPGHPESETEYLGQNIKKVLPKPAAENSGKRDKNGAGAAVNPSKKPVREIKIRFRETGAFVYVSHLDINRAFMRALIKSKLPLYYTEGFNPIPKITFASPLSVGSGGENELARIKLVEDVPDEVILQKLRRSMPEGLEVLEVYSSDSKFREIAWALNDIIFKCDAADDTAKKVEQIFKSPVVVEKRTKSFIKEVDITPLVKSLTAEKTENGITVHAVTCADSDNYLNAEYVAQVIAEKIDPEEKGYHVIMRQKFMLADGTDFR
ncbi:MAG: TIGR03936 family radical SAM-associated protein, partial [Clostridia bacterium]|nr:TIGR03936 family radical SAM-associated protein [Clostridia bacterium]